MTQINLSDLENVFEIIKKKRFLLKKVKRGETKFNTRFYLTQ